MFKKLTKGGSEASRLIRRTGRHTPLLDTLILSPAGTLRLDEVVSQALWPAFLFTFVLLASICSYKFNNEGWWDFIVIFMAVLVVVWPTIGLCVFVGGIWKTVKTSVARSSAVVFWLYWPFWRFVLCVSAVLIAWSIGNYLWLNNFRLYIEYHRLQAYDNVDAFTVTGNRMQDAGLVVFNKTNGVDLAKGACVVNGHTYCIAPILQNGTVEVGEKQSRTGINDLFVAGIDCCNCPMTDFRCGEWDNPRGPLGGMRVLDEETRRMYRLAVDKCNADYQKVSVHSIFFTWNNDPVTAWKQLYSRGVHLAIAAFILGILGSFFVTVLLNGFMKLLRDWQLAAPLDNNQPPMLPGLSFATERKSFIPDEYRSYLAQQELLAEPDPKFVIL